MNYFLNGQLQGTLSQAPISLLLKKDKDLLLCSSWRPILLLNVDQRNLVKVFYNHLQMLPDLISPDQTGFIHRRHSFFNTRQLLDIIHTPSSESPKCVLSLDTEKAFNRVERNCLFFCSGKNGI